jgi:Ca2+-binding RTX toxin-like protein
MSGSYSSFFAALRIRESSGNYAAVNTFNYLGAYQFGEAALVDLAMVRRDPNPFDNNYSGGFTGKLGVDSKAEFFASRDAQDAIAGEWFNILWSRIRYQDLEVYDHQTLNGIKLTKGGMIAASHLLGTETVKNFIKTGGIYDVTDAYGTKLTEYLQLFANYATPSTFVNNLGNANRIEAGSGNDRLNGYGGNDTLIAGAGRDILFGGTGKDNLFGGSGADRFDFRKLHEGGDNIRDFSSTDSISIEGSEFGLGPYRGQLPTEYFWRSSSNSAHDTNDRFVFRTTDDTLWFDANGNKAGGLTLLADFATNVSLRADDILVL